MDGADLLVVQEQGVLRTAYDSDVVRGAEAVVIVVKGTRAEARSGIVHVGEVEFGTVEGVQAVFEVAVRHQVPGAWADGLGREGAQAGGVKNATGPVTEVELDGYASHRGVVGFGDDAVGDQLSALYGYLLRTEAGAEVAVEEKDLPGSESRSADVAGIVGQFVKLAFGGGDAILAGTAAPANAVSADSTGAILAFHLIVSEGGSVIVPASGVPDEVTVVEQRTGAVDRGGRRRNVQQHHVVDEYRGTAADFNVDLHPVHDVVFPPGGVAEVIVGIGGVSTVHQRPVGGRQVHRGLEVFGDIGTRGTEVHADIDVSTHAAGVGHFNVHGQPVLVTVGSGQGTLGNVDVLVTGSGHDRLAGISATTGGVGIGGDRSVAESEPPGDGTISVEIFKTGVAVLDQVGRALRLQGNRQ